MRISGGSHLPTLFSTKTLIDIVDLENYEVLFINQYGKDLLGYDPVGQKCYQVFHNRESACEFCNNSPLLSDPSKTEQWEYYSDKLERHMLANNQALEWHDGRKVKLELSFDITDRRKTEKALRESQMFLLETQRSARLGGWRTNPLTDELKWTDGVYDIIEAPRDYTPGLAEGLKYFCPEYLTAIKEVLERCLTQGEHLEMEVEIITDKGNRRWVELRASARGNSPEKQGIIGTIQDISDRKKAEADTRKLQAQLQKAHRMESMGHLAGGVAHDFNNLLTPIIGLSELLLEDLPMGTLQSENIKEILKAGKRGSDLVKQILAFSRQSEHKMVPTRLQNVIKEVLTLSRSTIPTNIQIRQDIQADCGIAMADPTKIHQVAMNIITNAYHAVEESGDQITVTLKEVSSNGLNSCDIDLEPGQYAVLSVSDTGHGLPPELMEKIFEPYFTTKKEGKGTGIGLSVAYGIVKEHRGTIKVESEIGKGSTFTVYLPLMEKSGGPQSVETSETWTGGNERILLVFSLRLLLQIGLKKKLL